MIHTEQIEVWTVQLLARDIVCNANCATLKRAQEMAETLSEQQPYVPVLVTDNDGNRYVYLEGEYHANYSEADDLELKTERFDRGED